MKVAVFSDLHGGDSGIIENSFENCDYVIFLGDGLSAIKDYEFIYPEKFIYVRGNCDDYDAGPNERIVDIACKRILITHGDAYRVKSGILSLLKAAKECSADIVLYGHTHVASDEELDGVRFINPGSAMSGGYRKASYCLIEFKNEKCLVEIITF